MFSHIVPIFPWPQGRPCCWVGVGTRPGLSHQAVAGADTSQIWPAHLVCNIRVTRDIIVSWNSSHQSFHRTQQINWTTPFTTNMKIFSWTMVLINVYIRYSTYDYYWLLVFTNSQCYKYQIFLDVLVTSRMNELGVYYERSFVYIICI